MIPDKYVSQSDLALWPGSGGELSLFTTLTERRKLAPKSTSKRERPEELRVTFIIVWHHTKQTFRQMAPTYNWTIAITFSRTFRETTNKCRPAPDSCTNTGTHGTVPEAGVVFLRLREGIAVVIFFLMLAFRVYFACHTVVSLERGLCPVRPRRPFY